MKRLFDYRCQTSKVLFEKFGSLDDKEIPCRCGGTATRVISAVRSKLDPISGDFPGETIKWSKMREKEIKRERKWKDNHGPTDGTLKSQM